MDTYLFSMLIGSIIPIVSIPVEAIFWIDEIGDLSDVK
jgi:hypothetical protein